MMIFGIGLPKSGTTSLAHALSQLGYRTYRWPNSWRVRILWEGNWEIPYGLRGVEAFVNFGEWYYPKLDKLFPGSRFILTVRNLEAWLTSCRRWFVRNHSDGYLYPSIFGISVFDEDIFRDVYHRHTAAVMEYFRVHGPDRLLVFTEPFEWEPLCAFLGRPKPNIPYPHDNIYSAASVWVDHVNRRQRNHDRCGCILDRTPIDRPIVGVEVGVLGAGLSARLLEARPNLTLHLVDRWEAPPKDSPYVRTGDPNALHPPERWPAIYAEAKRRVERYGERAVIHKMESTLAAQKLCGHSFDFVFLDADHSVEGCSADIEAWWPLVKPGGWIGGHDYNSRWGVPKAVDAFARRTGLPVERDADSTWFVWKPA